MSEVLVDVTTQIRNSLASNRRTAVVFDLDSTLFCVSPRTQAILRALGQTPEFLSRYATVAEQLRAIEITPAEYSVRRIIERLNITYEPDLFNKIRDFWRDHFFSSKSLHHDILYPGARDYVAHLHALGAHVLYLTGRPSSRMREGTERVLRESDFPAYQNLLMKPDEADSDEHFKVVELRRLLDQYDEIWFFENEPIILRDVCAMLPSLRIVFVDSVHAGKEKVPENLPTIEPDYRIF